MSVPFRFSSIVRYLTCLCFCLAALLFITHSDVRAQSDTIAELSVHAEESRYVNAPVSASLEGVPLQLERGELQLFEITNGEEVPVASQLKAGNPNRLVWILHGETEPGAVRNYELRVVDAATAAASNPSNYVQLRDDGESLLLSIGDAPVLNYRYALMDVPEGVDEIFMRGGYIHPIWSPEGEVLSRIQPPDHYHHYGIWNPWTRTEFEGREVDFWNLGSGQGTVRAEHVLERTQGAVHGGFKAVHDHVDFTGPSGEKVALNERWEVDVWNVDPDGDVWLVDFTSILSPATEEPLTIKEYRYQGFSLRATERWNDDNATLLTSEGYDKSDANGTRARWIDVNGESDAQAGTSGILFMTNPANFNFPEQLRIWPEGMNDGVENVYINFNPAQDRDWALKPGNSYALTYRMLVYDGEITEDEANAYWRSFANPPRVEVHPIATLLGANVLIYTRNGEGYVHENIPYSVEALEELGAEYGFTVEATDDPSYFTDNRLQQYDALVFSNTNNVIFEDDSQREALQNFVRQGGGVVGIHSASGSEREWAWFSKLMGGNFERHAPIQDFDVSVVDTGHPSTSFLPASWSVEEDECYYLVELNPGIRVLLAADLGTVEDDQKDDFPGNIFGERFPVTWYQKFEGARQWYTSLGHRPEHYADPAFRRHVLGGLAWVVSGVPH